MEKLNKTLNQIQKNMKHFRETKAKRKRKHGLMKWKKMGNERKGVNTWVSNKITKMYLSILLSPLRKNKHYIKN